MRSIDKKCQGEAKIGNTDKRCHKISWRKGLTEPKRLGYTLCMDTKTAQKIEEAFGPFILVGSKNFEAHGQQRVIYTVRKPKGQKFYHVIEYENGVVR